MTIQEIFEQKDIKEVECEILNIESKDRRLQRNNSSYQNKEEIITPLLKVRKRLLDNAFASTNSYVNQLSIFNTVIKRKQEEIRQQVHSALSIVLSSRPQGDVRAYSSWFFAPKYPDAHPVQTIRAKKMWRVLNGPCGYSGSFCDGIDSGPSNLTMYFDGDQSDTGIMRFHDVDYHEAICGIPVCPILYKLYKYSLFSLFDMVWVTAFDVHVHVRENYANYKRNIDEADIPGWIE